MSEDFDKEAEREKLREQFAEEEEDRKATQQMSELLLRGATMTNQHCPTCGDPIFRHNGQEFCPSCQGPGGGQAAQEAQRGQGQQAAQGDRGQQAAQGQQRDQQTADSPATQSPGQGRAQDAPAEQATDDATAGEPAARQPDDADAIEVQTPGEAARTPDDDPATPAGAGEAVTSPDAPAQRQDDAADRRAGQGAAATTTGTVPAAGDRGDARANVELALERFAAMAAETDDPRRAKECLAAAREAAATLAELRR